MLGIKGQLTMGQQGNITNENENFNIDETGVNFAVDSVNPLVATTLNWQKNGHDDATIGTSYIGVTDDLIIDYKADSHQFYADNLNIFEVNESNVKSYVPVTLTVYSNASRPDPTTLPEGSIIYNRDQGAINYVNSSGAWESTK